MILPTATVSTRHGDIEQKSEMAHQTEEEQKGQM